jgi:hypothetical protein
VKLGVVALLAASALGWPVSAWASAAFRTPARAAYCGATEGEGPIALICWTPNDGFTIGMGVHGRPEFSYDRRNRGYHESVRTLRFGQTWRMRAWWRCTSRRTGLTCVNRDGHGWWLGRFRGYRVF